MSSIIIRIQSDLGFLRLTVNSNDTIQSLRSKISSTYKISYDDFLICTERHRMSIDHVWNLFNDLYTSFYCLSRLNRY